MIATSIEQIPNIPALMTVHVVDLLHSAAYLFHKQGYDKTTVRELAPVYWNQSGSLFHHFKSKDDISLM